MFKIFISLLAIFILLVSNELLWKKYKTSGELSRKIVHIAVAVFVSVWPYYLTYKQIQLMAVAFFVVVLISRKFHLFKSIRNIKRKSLGDLFFPLSILVLAVVAPNKWVFTVAMLETGIADGLAALIGKKYGKKNRYKVFGQTKSVVGTGLFITISYCILIVTRNVSGEAAAVLSWPVILFLPILLAFAENVAVYGADDLLIPIMILFVLG